jgi:hypothetical protein
MPLPTYTTLAAKLAQFFTASDKSHAIINGADNETVETEAGDLPTMAKALKDFEDKSVRFDLDQTDLSEELKLQARTNCKAARTPWEGAFDPRETPVEGANIHDEFMDTSDSNNFRYRFNGLSWIPEGSRIQLSAAINVFSIYGASSESIAFDTIGGNQPYYDYTLDKLQLTRPDLTQLLLVLGISSYTDLTEANTSLAIGKIYYDTTLETLNVTTA